MEAWREELYANELWHHGIKGQQWGERNGPPYPLDKSTHKAVVRSARKENRGTEEQKKDTRKFAGRTVGRALGAGLGVAANTMAAGLGAGLLIAASGGAAIPVAASIVAASKFVNTAFLATAGAFEIKDIVGYSKRTNARVNEIVDRTLEEIGDSSMTDFNKAADNK